MKQDEYQAGIEVTIKQRGQVVGRGVTEGDLIVECDSRGRLAPKCRIRLTSKRADGRDLVIHPLRMLYRL